MLLRKCRGTDLKDLLREHHLPRDLAYLKEGLVVQTWALFRKSVEMNDRCLYLALVERVWRLLRMRQFTCEFPSWADVTACDWSEKPNFAPNMNIFGILPARTLHTIPNGVHPVESTLGSRVAQPSPSDKKPPSSLLNAKIPQSLPEVRVSSAYRQIKLIPYPFHTALTPVAAPILSWELHGNRTAAISVIISLTRDQLALLATPNSAYKVMLYRQQVAAVDRQPIVGFKFLDYAGCTFKVMNIVILKVTSTRDTPINITDHVIAASQQIQTLAASRNVPSIDPISIQCEFSYAMLFSSCPFVFSCVLVHEKPAEWARLWAERIRINIPQFHEAFDSNGQSKDDDLEAEFTSLSLRCPLSYTRITFPARSKHCKHRQCFDLVNYLNLYVKKMKRTCPVCQVSLILTDLMIDEMFVSYLCIAPPNQDEIFIDARGKITAPPITKVDGRNSPTALKGETKTVFKNEVVDLSFVSDDVEDDLLSRFAPIVAKKEPILPVHTEELEPENPVAFFIID